MQVAVVETYTSADIEPAEITACNGEYSGVEHVVFGYEVFSAFVQRFLVHAVYSRNNFISVDFGQIVTYIIINGMQLEVKRIFFRIQYLFKFLTTVLLVSYNCFQVTATQNNIIVPYHFVMFNLLIRHSVVV